jgi:hypothetical protein
VPERPFDGPYGGLATEEIVTEVMPYSPRLHIAEAAMMMGPERL